MNAPGIAALFLRLEGPLQSWGDSARWSVRNTQMEPTKSGVLGIIACASGWGLDAEGDRKTNELARSIRFAVREDRPGSILRDYHTVFGGVLQAEGKIKLNATTREPETVVSERYYLSDACFLVALAGDEAVLESVRRSLERPVWVPFLGRRSCPPSAPLIPALPGDAPIRAFPDLKTAITTHRWIARRGEMKPPARLRYAIEFAPGDEMSAQGIRSQRRDQPISFSRRILTYRSIIEDSIEGLEE